MLTLIEIIIRDFSQFSSQIKVYLMNVEDIGIWLLED